MKKAYSAVAQMRIERKVQTQVRQLLQRAQKQSWTQEDILIKRSAIYADVPEYPRSLREYLRGYFDGLFDQMTKEYTIFLYKIDNTLYTTNQDQLAGLNTWMSLPNWQTRDLTDCGGLYWRHSCKPFYALNR